MDFKNLGINENIINVLNKNGIKTPTPIQEESIPKILDGKDIIGEAKTGTGKTFAFLLPIFQNILPNSKDIQVLILSPTRELAIQITDECKKFNVNNDINILSVYGGKDIGNQLKKLKNNIHIIIATPGRLLDHINRKTINLSKLKTIVIDEADQMLLMGFKNDIEKIMKFTSKKHQMLCFSATIDSQVKKLAYRYMVDPLFIDVKSPTISIDKIKQEVIETTDRWKQNALCAALKEDNPFMAIIFCRTKRRADTLEIALHQKGFNCQKIHSDVPQAKRERIMKSFRKADIQYLIATDVAARGIDISSVSHIYNYDVPETPESYIHRIGRTGRAGEDGYTCMFIAPKDSYHLNEIEEKLGFKIPRREI
ncbi:DEAD/DEAH box helicase [Clostridium taeniosporum]|uniref:ATP-dependent helicase n=1 Tax=Clostridium taeniosporum TaxID=394958 RepID=A0A1D7XJJ6_9CLOT|nr:DEAD/DEAH box helicase [Clostridium taeniosporum]AOR23360.1 ATP-dependent helicase [Clostridium taeniosporum]